MMRKNLAIKSVNYIIDQITQSEIGNHKSMCMFLFLVIGIGLLSSLLVPTIMTNAQAYSSASSTSSGGNSTSSGSGVREMGICVVGAGGPCNGDSNWDSTHDKTGKCVLLNGCGNDDYNGNNNKSTNNNVNGK
jgi:hypothetical protein